MRSNQYGGPYRIIAEHLRNWLREDRKVAVAAAAAAEATSMEAGGGTETGTETATMETDPPALSHGQKLV